MKFDFLIVYLFVLTTLSMTFIILWGISDRQLENCKEFGQMIIDEQHYTCELLPK